MRNGPLKFKDHSEESRARTVPLEISTRETRHQVTPKVKLSAGMGLFSSLRLVRFVLATLLSFWIAGAGCILGCESMVAVAAAVHPDDQHHSEHNSIIVASGKSCASQKSHDCCKKSETEVHSVTSQQGIKENSVIASGRSAPVPANCPFAANRAAAVTKAQGSDENASSLPVDSKPPAQNSVEQTVSLARPLRLPNRGHTYLRCCVFLI